MARSVAGRLLVATPVLLDPNFARTVILMIEHDGDGALGVVVNRPSDTPLHEPLPGWGDLAAGPGVIFVGGPVQPEAAICLARAAEPDPPRWSPVVGATGTFDLDGEPPDRGIAAVRVFAGYAGWAPGQLDDELAEGAWWVVDADPDDAFAPEPGRLWNEVLGRQPGRLGWLRHYPPDPALN